MKLFIKPLYINKPFQILSPVSISISCKNITEVLLISKKCCQAKFCLVDVWS